MKVAAVGVGFPADLRPAVTAPVVVLVAARQDEQELLPDGRRPLAEGAEETRRLQFAKAVCHALILDQGGGGSAWSASSSQVGGAMALASYQPALLGCLDALLLPPEAAWYPPASRGEGAEGAAFVRLGAS